MWTWYRKQDEFPIPMRNSTNPTPIRRSPTPSIPTRRISAGADLGVPAVSRRISSGRTSTPSKTALPGRRRPQPLFGEDFMSHSSPPLAASSRQATAVRPRLDGADLRFFYNPALFEPPADSRLKPGRADRDVPADQGRWHHPWTFNESDKWLGADFFLPLIAQATDDTNWSTIRRTQTKEGVSWNSERSSPRSNGR